MEFTKGFDSFVCMGDTIEMTHKGITYIATLEYDDHCDIDDDDSHNVHQEVTGCDDDQQERLVAAREAWAKGEWVYCGVVLSVKVSHITLSDHAASLWGIEANYPGSDNSYLLEVANDLLIEAEPEVEAAINIVSKLAGELE